MSLVLGHAGDRIVDRAVGGEAPPADPLTAVHLRMYLLLLGRSVEEYLCTAATAPVQSVARVGCLRH